MALALALALVLGCAADVKMPRPCLAALFSDAQLERTALLVISPAVATDCASVCRR